MSATQSKFALAAIVVLMVALWFSLLGARQLLEADEGRYAEIPREMLASGDWVTPRLDGFKYFEKPPLQYWLTAAGYAVLGVNAFAARLWPALLGLLGAGTAGFLAQRLYGSRAGFYAFVATLTTGLYWAMGQGLTLDMSVSVFLFVGIASLVLAQQQRDDWDRGRRWMWLGWAALAAATLCKGLIGIVLPGAAVVLYSLWQRDWRLWRHLELARGVALLLLLLAPWFLLVSLRNPEFAWFFFVREHVERFATEVHDRAEPFWYFLPVLLLGTLPWSVAYVRALVRPGFAWWPAPGGGFSAERFLWVFAAFVLVFFSLSDSKLPPYILPMLPPLAVLAARPLADRGGRTLAVVTLLAGLALGVAVWVALRDTALVAPRYAHDPLPAAQIQGAAVWGLWAAGTLVLAAVVAWRARPASLLRAGTYALLVLVALQFLAWGSRVAEHRRSSLGLATAILADRPGDAPIYAVGDYFPHSLPFYLRRTVQLVGITGELQMGIDLEPQRWTATLEDFAPVWLAAPNAYAVMNAASYEWARAHELPMRFLARNGRLVVVSRR